MKTVYINLRNRKINKFKKIGKGSNNANEILISMKKKVIAKKVIKNSNKVY